MTAPVAPLGVFATSDLQSLVEVSWLAAVASPAVIGYRLFRSSVSQADAVSLAQADITSQTSTPSGQVTDPESPVISGSTYTRGNVRGAALFVDNPTIGGVYFYALVAWNSSGASAIVVASVVHSSPTSSLISQAHFEQNQAIPEIVVDLCVVDTELLMKYGPLQLDLGGTFGVSTANPSGVFLAQNMVQLAAGQKLTVKLSSTTAAFAAAAATDWIQQIILRIQTLLTALRATGLSVIIGPRTITQV